MRHRRKCKCDVSSGHFTVNVILRIFHTLYFEHFPFSCFQRPPVHTSDMTLSTDLLTLQSVHAEGLLWTISTDSGVDSFLVLKL